MRLTVRVLPLLVGDLDSSERGYFNPLPPSDAVRKRKRNTLEDLFSPALSQFKKYHPSRNLKFNYLGISKSFKLRILKETFLLISLKLNFTPNTLGCNGLSLGNLCLHFHLIAM